MTWERSSSFDPRALAIVDGTGRFAEFGPHYSRRSPGSHSFTGVGREIVLVTLSGDAVWAVVYQRTPCRKGTGGRARNAPRDQSPRYVWRNMTFRNLGGCLSSDLIVEATDATYAMWKDRYGALPNETLRTEIDPRKVRSRNPGYCYMCAGWRNRRVVRGKIYLDAPPPRDPGLPPSTE